MGRIKLLVLLSLKIKKNRDKLHFIINFEYFYLPLVVISYHHLLFINYYCIYIVVNVCKK